MERPSPQNAQPDTVASAPTRARRGLTRPRFDTRCTNCGHTTTLSMAPDACPVCHASAWEYRPTDSELPAQSRRAERSESLTMLARKVIGTNSVRRWRFEQLRQAGYSIGDSLVLSGRNDVDLHQATRLLREGCLAATAVRILI
jgi:Rubrerythrin, rubredoxin-like domain